MVQKAHTSKKNNRKRGVTKRRKVRGGNVYATTMRAQRTMEHIVTDVNDVVAQLAELSAELQRQVQPGHPNVNLVALAQAENRQARQQHDPGHPNVNLVAIAQAENRQVRQQHLNAPDLPEHLQRIPPWQGQDDREARRWTFEGVHYMRVGNSIWLLDLIGNYPVGEWVGEYIPEENRINRNAPQPNYNEEGWVYNE
jgi:hypothetical protein